MLYRTFHKKILSDSFHDRGLTMLPYCGVQDIFLPLKESRSCLMAVEIIALLAFDYYYDCVKLERKHVWHCVCML
jgi:hypothetical protein